VLTVAAASPNARFSGPVASANGMVVQLGFATRRTPRVTSGN
jgi:hypothetical protein